MLKEVQLQQQQRPYDPQYPQDIKYDPKQVYQDYLQDPNVRYPKKDPIPQNTQQKENYLGQQKQKKGKQTIVLQHNNQYDSEECDCLGDCWDENQNERKLKAYTQQYKRQVRRKKKNYEPYFETHITLVQNIKRINFVYSSEEESQSDEYIETNQMKNKQKMMQVQPSKQVTFANATQSMLERGTVQTEGGRSTLNPSQYPSQHPSQSQMKQSQSQFSLKQPSQPQLSASQSSKQFTMEPPPVDENAIKPKQRKRYETNTIKHPQQLQLPPSAPEKKKDTKPVYIKPVDRKIKPIPAQRKQEEGKIYEKPVRLRKKKEEQKQSSSSDCCCQELCKC